MSDQSAVIAVLYLSAVLFFALWRNERTRRFELIRMAREEVSRQRAVLGALELAELDAIREIV